MLAGVFCIGLLTAFTVDCLIPRAVPALTSAERKQQAESSAAARKRERERKGGTTDPKKDKDAKKAEAKKQDSVFLPEKEETEQYTPDLWRCPDCGYEQDEAGICPDHAELVQVLAKGKNPFEAPELDGNEDLIVDIPLPTMKYYATASRAADLASGTAQQTGATPGGGGGANRSGQPPRDTQR